MTNSTFTNALGYEYKVMEVVNSACVIVQFTETGYLSAATAGNVRRGKIKDKIRPEVFDVGYIGDGIHKSMVDNKATKEYRIWHHMLQRCYDVRTEDARPTYNGCLVDSRWHNFQTFCEDIKELDGYDEWLKRDDMELDKDSEFKGCKLYSRHTCKFITKKDNLVEARARYWNFISPEGEHVEIYNLAEFCRNNGLDKTNMRKVSNGKAKSCKGWKKA